MYLCYVESLSSFRLQFFKLWPFFKIGQFLKNTLYYSPCFFSKNGPENAKNFGQFLKNTLYYSPCFFPKNGFENAKKFYYIF